MVARFFLREKKILIDAELYFLDREKIIFYIIHNASIMN